jgi:hypothetical protein
VRRKYAVAATVATSIVTPAQYTTVTYKRSTPALSLASRDANVR